MTPAPGTAESVFVRGLRTLREEGLRVFLLKVLAVLGYRRIYVLRRSLTEPIEEVPTVPTLTIDWLSSDDLGAYLAMGPEYTTAERRMQAGDRCLVARRDGCPVGAMWASRTTASSETLGVTLPLAPGEAYVYGAFTPPEFRGLGIAPALSAAWHRRLRDEGCTAAIRLTLPENSAALRAHAKAGYRREALLRCLRIGPWRYVFAPRAIASAGVQ